jgi:hypothetical protein
VKNRVHTYEKKETGKIMVHLFVDYEIGDGKRNEYSESKVASIS